MALWSVQRTVAVAVGLGVAGLVAGLIVYYVRGGLGPKPTPEPPAPPANAPANKLDGLRYLPADTNVVFALRPGPALAYAARTKQDPRELILKAGLPAKLLDTVGGLGLTLPQIDHLVGGLALGDGPVELRLTLALVLKRSPDDEDEFLRRLKAKKQAGGKSRYDAELGGLPVTAARVSPTVWVFGFDANKDLAAVDRGGYEPGGSQFAVGLREMIAERVPPDAAAWLATGDERWAEKPAVKLVIETFVKKPEWLPALARGRAALAALSLEDPPRLRLFVRAADEATGQQIRAYFAARAKTNDAVQHGGAGEVAFCEMPIDPATGLATLQQFFADAGKK